MTSKIKRQPILLHDQIQKQYATIIRSQHTMFVRDKDDIEKEISQSG